MAKTTQKDILTRLADAGEDAIKKLQEMPGTHRMLDTANALRARVDELQKRVRGLDELEERVAKLEKRVAQMEKAKTTTRARAATASKPRARKTPPKKTGG